MGVRLIAQNVLPAFDQTPLLDGDGHPLDEHLRRLNMPRAFYRAVDDLPGGMSEDPMQPGYLGDRWYYFSSPLDDVEMPYSGFSQYRRLLTEAFWPEAERRQPIEFSQHLPFWDLVHVPDHSAVLSAGAVSRLRESYREHTSIIAALNDQQRLRGADLTTVDAVHTAQERHTRLSELLDAAGSRSSAALVIC